MNVLVTGGAGFIGSHFVRMILRETQNRVINIDNLTYAGNLANLADIQDNPNYAFVKGDIVDPACVEGIMAGGVDSVVNFAAESHVDRSIMSARPFVRTNVEGTLNLLEHALRHKVGRFIQVSTDEVFGSLAPDAKPFTEESPFAPNSPYAASKAAADLMCRAFFQTHGAPVIVTNCSNNYGFYQYPEKMIPLMIQNALSGKQLPIYGDGLQVRDWLHVEDHCAAVLKVLEKGRIGQTYCIGGSCEKKNIEIVHAICGILDEFCPKADGISYIEQITHIADRPAHDRRYAINSSRIQTELGWAPTQSFDAGLRATIQWYISHQSWVKAIMDKSYSDWIEYNYSPRMEI